MTYTSYSCSASVICCIGRWMLGHCLQWCSLAESQSRKPGWAPVHLIAWVSRLRWQCRRWICPAGQTKQSWCRGWHGRGTGPWSPLECHWSGWRPALWQWCRLRSTPAWQYRCWAESSGTLTAWSWVLTLSSFSLSLLLLYNCKIIFTFHNFNKIHPHLIDKTTKNKPNKMFSYLFTLLRSNISVLTLSYLVWFTTVFNSMLILSSYFHCGATQHTSLLCDCQHSTAEVVYRVEQFKPVLIRQHRPGLRHKQWQYKIWEEKYVIFWKIFCQRNSVKIKLLVDNIHYHVQRWWFSLVHHIQHSSKRAKSIASEVDTSSLL